MVPVIVVLNQNSLLTARQILSVLPEAKIYGLVNRTSDVDMSFADFGDTLRELFARGTPIIGICAAGILIRTLSPLLKDKWQEPPLLAVAEDGSAVVPLLGGLHGVNDLARLIADVFQVSPAITTTGDIRFRTTLLSPPSGYHLANPEDAKTFIADLLSGATVKLEGEAAWLRESKLPIASDGELTIKVTEKETALTDLLGSSPSYRCLLYHPKNIVIGISSNLALLSSSASDRQANKAIATLRQQLTLAQLSPISIGGIFALDSDPNYSFLEAIAKAFQAPLRFFKPNELNPDLNLTEALAIQAVGETGKLLISQANFAIASALLPLDVNHLGKPRGKLAIVGTGPGGDDWLSPEVRGVLESSTDWVGYKTYLDLVEHLRKDRRRHESDNRVEIARAKTALDLAAQGRSVAVISSGDPGIFAMAAAVFEALELEDNPEWQNIDIEVCPGISAMQAAAAAAGAPLGHDFCVISLSDILKPWSVIEERIDLATKADFVIAFYNPVSKERTWQLDKAKEIISRSRSPQTPVILARNLGRVGQSISIKTLDLLTSRDADMRTVILIGSTTTRLIRRADGNLWVYTPRRSLLQ
jgi:cobalt-precorrin 5A hydrolase/precorrin-3B C17-methyltransferase